MLIQNNHYNIGYICTKQQCDQGLSQKIALRWISAKGDIETYSFRDLDRQSNKFANILHSFDFSQGDIFFTLLPKCPEQFFSFLGILKKEIICGTLFSNFGDEALLDRLGDSGAKGIVTKKSCLKKICRIKPRLPKLEYIFVVDIDEHLDDGIYSYQQLMNNASEEFVTPLTLPDTPSVLHYTSGSTGKPKGVLHVHKSILHQMATARDVLKLAPDEIYWNTADQGWITGTSYGIIGPWSLGVTQVHFAGKYDACRWLQLLEQEKITIWYSAPTALRMLMQQSDEFYQEFDLSHLKYIFSAGEPLNPEVIFWSKKVLQKDIYDTWFQTETGGIMITNRPGLDIRPGSMGKPVDGIEPVILGDRGQAVANGKQGELCFALGWPSMFVTYLNSESAYQQKFIKNYYYTGDLASKDAEGYYWFQGRSDDVINTGGHLVSPFEIESALLELGEVAESGVIGVPDDILFEKVIVFVRLNPGVIGSKELEVKLRLYVSNKVSSIATPQNLIFIDRIPKSKSGKIMRRVLKARYLGEEEGDTSMLEN